MGCGVNKGREIRVSRSENRTMFANKNINDKAQAITQKSWLNVLDYLNYSELKEVGRTSRLFNYLVRQNKILIKFFKKKNNGYQNRNYNKIIESFSVLQKNFVKNNSIISDYSTSSEEKVIKYNKKY